MLATVLGCVCLGIASLIYLAVSWQLFNIFLQSNPLITDNLDIPDEEHSRKQRIVDEEDIVAHFC